MSSQNSRLGIAGEGDFSINLVACYHRSRTRGRQSSRNHTLRVDLVFDIYRSEPQALYLSWNKLNKRASEEMPYLTPKI